MGLGIQEPKHETHVAGTVLLDDAYSSSTRNTQTLKHSTGSDAHIILAPQPSNDPNDPLNWSYFERHLILGILCFGTIVHGATLVSPLIVLLITIL